MALLTPLEKGITIPSPFRKPAKINGITTQLDLFRSGIENLLKTA